MKKYIETQNERNGGVFGLTVKKSFIYEANGVKVRDFSDQDLHEMQATDILQFMKEVIVESEKAEMRQTFNYGWGQY